MNKEVLLEMVNDDKEFAKRNVKKEIEVIRGILDRFESSLDDEKFYADNGLQGNEWRLYRELSNYERLNEFSKQLNKLQDKEDGGDE